QARVEVFQGEPVIPEPSTWALVLLKNIFHNHWKRVWPPARAISFALCKKEIGDTPAKAVSSNGEGVASDQLYRQYYQQGLDLLKQSRLEESLASFRKALQCRPGDANAEKAIRLLTAKIQDGGVAETGVQTTEVRGNAAMSAPEGEVSSVVEKLETLKTLHEKGMISDEEYSKKKQELIDRL
ncbi:MAG: SHOCT domain-containing protein, partial [Pontiellaceae bacterium]|nr:SHOCT domain-containing protein [Pontiellaceae bacterium]